MNNRQELRDNTGRLLGTITIGSNGRHEGRDPTGRLKGTYDPRTNETRDPTGRLIGKGDMLSTLILSP